jgi:hypothetical protein
MFRNSRSLRTLGVSFSVMLSLAGLCFLSACGGGGSIPQLGGTPAQVVSGGLSLTLTGSSHAMDVSQSLSLTATVKNDPLNGMIKWTVTCPVAVVSCGSIAHASTASGAANTFTAPGSVSAEETITLTAISVSDPRASASFQITVNRILSLVIPSPAQPLPVTVGQAFSLNLAQFVQGGTAPLAWRIASGSLPAGLTLSGESRLNSNPGMITGVAKGPPITAVVDFTATDSSGTPMSVSVPITVTVVPLLPLVLSPSGGALPDGKVGVRYNLDGFKFSAAGGVQPYVWGWVASSSGFPPIAGLPDGLTFNGGLLDGIPTAAGAYNLVVTVTDSRFPATQTSAHYTLNINR